MNEKHSKMSIYETTINKPSNFEKPAYTTKMNMVC